MLFSDLMLPVYCMPGSARSRRNVLRPPQVLLGCRSSCYDSPPSCQALVNLSVRFSLSSALLLYASHNSYLKPSVRLRICVSRNASSAGATSPGTYHRIACLSLSLLLKIHFFPPSFLFLFARTASDDPQARCEHHRRAASLPVSSGVGRRVG